MAKGIKTGGRAKGSTNKINNDVKKAINEFISNNIADIQTVYDSLEPKEKIQYLTKLLEYSVPKLKAVEQNINAGNELKINIKGLELF